MDAKWLLILWSQAGLADFPCNLIEVLVISGDALYASAWGDGVFRSEDGGKSWHR